MNKSAIYLVILAIVISVVIFWSWSAHTNPEQDVYFAYFSQLKDKNMPDNSIILSRPSSCGATKAHGIDLPSDTFTNFLNANTDEIEPIRLLSLEGLIPIVGWGDTKKLNKSRSALTRGTAVFPPDGRIGFMISRVGFNKNKSQAIMCVEYSEGLSGWALLLYFELEESNWDLKRSSTIWITSGK